MDPDWAVMVTPTPRREQLREPAAAGGAEDELGGVLGAGEVEQGGGDVVADDLVVGAAEGFDEGALPGQGGRVGAGQAVAAGDVHGEQVGAACCGRRCGRRGG